MRGFCKDLAIVEKQRGGRIVYGKEFLYLRVQSILISDLDLCAYRNQLFRFYSVSDVISLYGVTHGAGPDKRC